MADETGAQGGAKSPQDAPGASVPFGGTVTLFFSDIRGFTDYTEQFGDEAAYRILREHNTIVRKQIDAFGGVVVKTQGDSFMVAFTTARGAILCAIAIQRAVGEANRNHSGPRIAIGIGINTGEPIQEGGDYFGSMVNLAARICATADPGQILVAETTRYVAGRIESVEYVDRGLHELKGFPEARRLCEVIWRPPESLAPAKGPVARAGDVEETAVLVQGAIGVLNRVVGLTHLDDPTFAPLIECQARAGDLRLALSRALSERRPVNMKQAEDLMLPFENLMILVQDRGALNEQRWEELEANVARTFGRPLVTAAARGRLSVAGTEQQAEPAQPPKMPEPAEPPPSLGRLVEAPALPPPDARTAAVRWWSGASGAWSQWKRSGIGYAHALRAELGKCPHLLSVPIQSSAGHDGGRLADGYFILLEHAENQSPGFMRTVVDRAVQGAHGSLESDVLGAALYRALVDGGKLRETFGGLVRDIIGIAIPNPGVWADGGVIEHDDVTVAVMRASGYVGDPSERTVQLTDPAERVVDHGFEVTVEPLTARFFYVKPGELRTSHDVDFKVTVNGKPSDLAWYLTLRMSLIVRSEPKLMPKEGISLPGLGREYAGAWVAVFNPDPDAPASYELIVAVKPPRQQTLAARRSPFGPPLR
jgi:class 3 adenylate cyclase